MHKPLTLTATPRARCSAKTLTVRLEVVALRTGAMARVEAPLATLTVFSCLSIILRTGALGKTVMNP